MTNIALEFQPYDRLDGSGLRHFYDTIYPGLDWSPRYMDWQYEQNPAGQACTWVALSDGSIVGSVTAIPHQVFSADAGSTTGWRVQDVLTSPDFRGRGVFSSLLRLANVRISATQPTLNFTFPNERSHPFFIKSGWIAAEQIPLWSRRVGPPTALEGTPKAVTRFDQTAGEAWAAERKHYQFVVERTPEFLQWRYVLNPRKGFIPLSYEWQGELGFVVVKLFDHEDGARFAHICEVFSTATRELGDALIRIAENLASAAGAEEITLWHQSAGPMAGTLGQLGYRLDRNIKRWHVRSISQGITEGRWHIAMGDSDVY